MKLNPIKIWFKKTKFFGRKNLLVFLYMILPFIIFTGIILSFFNQYHHSFEEFSYQEVGSDIGVYSKNEDFHAINKSLKETLPKNLYQGMVRERYFFMYSKNLSIINPLRLKEDFYQNINIRFGGFKFSSIDFRNKYVERFGGRFEGRFPSNNEEIISSFGLKKSFNLSIGSILHIKFNKTINFNVTVTGFYEIREEYKVGLRGGFLFINYGLNEQLLKIQKEDNFVSSNRYDILLDYSKMDIFNINSFTATLETHGKTVETIFKEETDDFDIRTAASNYFSQEFEEFMQKNLVNFYVLMAPIILIGLIFATLLSRYLKESEINYWKRIQAYLSEKQIKTQASFDLFVNSIISYIVGLPTGIGLYILVNAIFQSDIKSIYISISFFITTLVFSVLFFVLVFYFLNKNITGIFERTEEERNTSENFQFPKKYKIFILILVISPFIYNFMNYIALDFYNPLLSTFSLILKILRNFTFLFYSFILIVFIIFMFVRFFPKILHFFGKFSFRKKLKQNLRFNLLKSFFQAKNKFILFLIAILSLELGFINHFIFTNVNRAHQQELDIYVKYGADYVVYERFSHENMTLNISSYIEEKSFCELELLQGKVLNTSVREPYFALFTFNPVKYVNVLNNHSQRVFPKDLISRIENLKKDEILLPRYYNLRYDLQVGDVLKTSPHNNSLQPTEFSDEYQRIVKVKGFYPFFPGFDQSRKPFNSIFTYSDRRGFIGIASPDINFSSQFPNIPTRPVYLVKDPDGEGNVQQMMVQLIAKNETLAGSLQIESLQEGLASFQGYSSTFSFQTSIIMFSIFILIFFLMSILFIYNYISLYKGTWTLLQLFGMPKRDIKSFLSKSLFGIYFLSFLFGLLGIVSGSFVLISENIGFKYHFYLYPIELIMDPLGILLNILFLIGSIMVILIYIFRISDFNLEYTYIRKYNPE
jgi:hypothetical protein